jgi:hypothetical protein
MYSAAPNGPLLQRFRQSTQALSVGKQFLVARADSPP